MVQPQNLSPCLDMPLILMSPFFYVALFALVFMYLWGANLMRSRDGRAFVAVAGSLSLSRNHGH